MNISNVKEYTGISAFIFLCPLHNVYFEAMDVAIPRWCPGPPQKTFYRTPHVLIIVFYIAPCVATCTVNS